MKQSLLVCAWRVCVCVCEIFGEVAEGMPGNVHCRRCVLILLCPAFCCPLLDIDWFALGSLRVSVSQMGTGGGLTRGMEVLLEGRMGWVKKGGEQKDQWKDRKLKERWMMNDNIDWRKAALVLFRSHDRTLSPTPSLHYSIDLLCYSWIKMTYRSHRHALCLRVCLQYINKKNVLTAMYRQLPILNK